MLNGETVTNTGGTLKADSGATLDLTNATIAGGLLTGGGTIQTLGSGSDSTLDGSSGHPVTIDTGTTVTVNVGTTLDLTGAIADNGTLTTALAGGTIDLESAGRHRRHPDRSRHGGRQHRQQRDQECGIDRPIAARWRRSTAPR